MIWSTQIKNQWAFDNSAPKSVKCNSLETRTEH